MTNVAAFQRELEYHIEGELCFDDMSRHCYSVDASIYEIKPIGCIRPRSKQDVINAVLIARKHEITITPRGAGTGIAGGAIGPGAILDTAHHLKRIREVNYEEEWAICEPGVVQDALNDKVREQGYRLGPDTSTGNRATIGGMVGNNSSGARSLRFGRTVDAVIACEVVLSDGEVLWLEELDDEQLQSKCTQDDSEGRIYRRVLAIREKYHDEIKKRYPNIHRRSSGYNLDHLVDGSPLNLAKLITGSEGSLGVITKVKIALTKNPAHIGVVICLLEDLYQGLDKMSALLALNPLAAELIDHQVIKMGRLSPSMRGKLDWIEGEPGGMLLVEVSGETEEEVEERMQAVSALDLGFSQISTTDPTLIENAWALRKAGLGLVMGRRSHAKAVAFIEDFAMPPTELAPFIRTLYDKVEGAGKKMGVYGHAGPGCMHFRPYVDMRKEEELQWMEELMIEMTDVVLHHGGVLSGEHGDGYLRSWLGERLFGPVIMEAFGELKAAFDPDGLMNPGKVIPTQGFRENLRTDPSVEVFEPKTVMSFKHEGGFSFAVNMCNGNAACRKESGLMCPSFHATGDERETTRARAQALRAALNGKLSWEEVTSEEVYKIMDLCLECKGCKTECPSQVDMAKMKSEWLHLYHEKHGAPLRSKLFAYLPSFNKLGAPIAKVANWINESPLAKWAFDRIGIATERKLPTLAAQRFSSWVRKEFHPVESDKKVVLFNDTFTEFNIPHVGKSAARLLTHLGYEVIIPPYTCCGRTLISKGFLPQAAKLAAALVEALYPFAREGIPIVGLEPSCILTLRDEVSNLVGGAKIRLIKDNCYTLDEFLANHGDLDLPASEHTVHVHGHCHQKSLVGMKSTMNVLEKIPGLTPKLIDSGCCGMAGSFGYEKEHYATSLKIGEHRLFPAVREAAAENLICADGYSCRCQIKHGTGRKAMHLAEVLEHLLPKE